MKYIKTFESFVNESQLNDTILNNARIYFYGLHLKNSRNGFSPYGIKRFKSIDDNSLTYTVWRFGEETITVPSGTFTFSVQVYKSEGNTIQDAYEHMSTVIKYIEDEIKKTEDSIVFLDTKSLKSVSQKKKLIRSSKKKIKYHEEIIKDIKSIKLK
jgi:hypothetical protein